jgi:hypothetical protein
MRQAPQRAGRHGREGVERRIGPPVAGHDRQRDAAGDSQFVKLVQPVAPIVHAAEQPHQHAPRARERVFQIHVHRQRVAQACEVGQPQRRQALAPPRPGSGEGAEVAV